MKMPVCVDCRVSFRPKRNGIYVLDMASKPAAPYQLWMADLLECPSCGAQIAAGFGQKPIAKHHEDDFDDFLRGISEDRIVWNYEREKDAKMAK